MATPYRHQHAIHKTFMATLALSGCCFLLAWGFGLVFSTSVWAQPFPENPYKQTPEEFAPNELDVQNPSPYFMPDLMPYENRFWPSATSTLYAPLTLEDRVVRLEKLLMGAPQTGNLMERQWHLLNALSHPEHQNKNGMNPDPASSKNFAATQPQSLAPLEGFSKTLEQSEIKSEIKPKSLNQSASTPIKPEATPQENVQGQLSRLEMAMFDKAYPRESTTKRLNRLEKARYGYKEDSFPIASRLAQLEASILTPVQAQQAFSSSSYSNQSGLNQSGSRQNNNVPFQGLQWNNQTTLQANDLGFMPQGNANLPRRGVSSTLGEVGRSLLNLGTLAGLGYLSYRSANNHAGWFQQGNGLYGNGFYGNGFYGIAPVAPFSGGLLQNTTPFIPPIGLPSVAPVYGSPIGSFGNFGGTFGGFIQPTPFIQSSPVPPGFAIPLGQPRYGY